MFGSGEKEFFSLLAPSPEIWLPTIVSVELLVVALSSFNQYYLHATVKWK